MEARQQHQAFSSAEPKELFKASVQICGKFLLKPEDDFSHDKADEMLKRSVKYGLKVRTKLKLLTSGMQLGEKGVFASMPLELIKYHRIAAYACPGDHQPRMLAVCTKDYEQKCVVLIKFKTADSLAEASRLIDSQRRLVAEEANYLLDSPTSHTFNSTSNWALETAVPTASVKIVKDQQRRSEPPMMAPDLFDARVTVPAVRAASAAVTRTSSSPVADEEDVLYALPNSQRRNYATTAATTTAGASNVGEGGRPPQIDTVILNFDEMPGNDGTYAVFESKHGPPTLLNEQVDVVHSQSHGSSNSAAAAGAVSTSASSRLLRVQTEDRQPVGSRRHFDHVDGGSSRQDHFVTYVTTSGSSAQRSSSLLLQQSLPQPQLVQLQYSPQPRQQQLVKLVPVRQRQLSQRHHQHKHQHQPRQLALYSSTPRSASLNGEYFLITK